MTTAPDMAASIEPKSDQLNAEDLLTGPRTVTITAVTRGNAEQPVNFVTAEFGAGRPYKPSKTMRRVIVAAWGTNSPDYVGRRMTLYREPDITFGPDRVGGIRISHLSHIDRRLEIALMVKRGRRSSFTVEPLADAPASITTADVAEFERRIAGANSMSELQAVAQDLKARDLGRHHKQLLGAWSERKAVISKPGQGGGDDVSQGAEPSSGAELLTDSRDQEPPGVKPATPQQLKRLNAIRQAEKWEADDEWHAYVQALTGTEVAADGQLTEAQAQAVIDEFGADQ